MDARNARFASAGRAELHVRGSNRLLAMLPAEERERLLSRMERRSFKLRDPIFAADTPIAHVHFPLHGVASLLIYMEDGNMVEVGTVGNEGMLGIPLLHGAQQSHSAAMFQSRGETLVMRAADFQAELSNSTAFRHSVQRYAQGFLSQTSQSAACNRLHHLAQRMCRWILMMHDRVGEDRLDLTQEFIAAMLGVRRATVNLTAGVLQEAGLIVYQRGIVQVLDRAGLEDGACECYEVVRKEFERLLC
jgi:CRP-like cAMP-binding protein